MRPSGFPPSISCHLFPCLEAVMMCNARWCWPCVIGVRHYRFHMWYISGSNYHLGLFSLETPQQRSQGRTRIKGDSNPHSSGRAPWHSSPRLALPWMLYWITSVEYHSFCFRKCRPVRIQAALVISYYKCVVIKGTAPGVGWGKELSLLVEDRVHPNPVTCGLPQIARNTLHIPNFTCRISSYC